MADRELLELAEGYPNPNAETIAAMNESRKPGAESYSVDTLMPELSREGKIKLDNH